MTFIYYATGIISAIALKMVGGGWQYARRSRIPKASRWIAASPTSSNAFGSCIAKWKKSGDHEALPMIEPATLEEPSDFSLVLGGPLFQFLQRAHLSGEKLEFMRRRVVVITCVAWVPILLLSVYEGHALGGTIWAVSFSSTDCQN
jgi:hypothetical protein